MSAIDFLLEKETRRQQTAVRRQVDITNVITVLLTGLMALFFILPFAGLVWRAVGMPPSTGVAFTPVLDALVLSLATTAVSMSMVVLLGTPTAFILARYQFPFKYILSIFIEIPSVMPPVAVANTSCRPSRRPTRRSSTASSRASRLGSKPLTTRCGVP